ncbi:hypothetical protein BDR04DRAFT_1118749 [Suillus decipiens]|nr:hypothetical protein BDR04DRAFT_1118749 [Suillus decipiens]
MTEYMVHVVVTRCVGSVIEKLYRTKIKITTNVMIVDICRDSIVNSDPGARGDDAFASQIRIRERPSNLDPNLSRKGKIWYEGLVCGFFVQRRLFPSSSESPLAEALQCKPEINLCHEELNEGIIAQLIIHVLPRSFAHSYLVLSSNPTSAMPCVPPRHRVLRRQDNPKQAGRRYKMENKCGFPFNFLTAIEAAHQICLALVADLGASSTQQLMPNLLDSDLGVRLNGALPTRTYCAFSNYVQQLLHIQLEVGFWGRAEFLKQAVW